MTEQVHIITEDGPFPMGSEIIIRFFGDEIQLGGPLLQIITPATNNLLRYRYSITNFNAGTDSIAINWGKDLIDATTEVLIQEIQPGTGYSLTPEDVVYFLNAFAELLKPSLVNGLFRYALGLPALFLPSPTSNEPVAG